MAALSVWTDGSCIGAGREGGWAWVTEDGQANWGFDPSTTNQRMELMAALMAMKQLRRELIIHTDSAYLHNCFRDEWYVGWASRGWMTVAGKPVANKDLWRPLIKRVKRYNVTFVKVRGHSGDKMNDKADKLAGRARLLGLNGLEE